MTAPAPHLTFAVEGTRFAVPATAVVEVVRAVALTPLAGAAGLVEGLFDLRGRVVPVLDLRACFGLPVRPMRPSDRLVVIDALGRVIAVRADRDVSVEPLAPDQLTPRSDIPLAGDARLAGVARLGSGMVLLYDPGAFLDQAEAASLDRALEAFGR